MSSFFDNRTKFTPGDKLDFYVFSPFCNWKGSLFRRTNNTLMTWSSDQKIAEHDSSFQNSWGKLNWKCIEYLPMINEYVQQPIRGTKLLVQLSSSGKYFVRTSTNQIIFPSILRMRLRRHNMSDKRFEQRMRRMSHSLERRCPLILMIDDFAWNHIVSHRYW